MAGPQTKRLDCGYMKTRPPTVGSSSASPTTFLRIIDWSYFYEISFFYEMDEKERRRKKWENEIHICYIDCVYLASDEPPSPPPNPPERIVFRFLGNTVMKKRRRAPPFQ